MSAPAVSILLPVYNAAPYVADAVRSILGQSFTDFECVIVNDGSTDASPAILESLAAQDSRIRLIHTANQGLVSALNTGLEAAQAPLVARMDADDISLPGRLATQTLRMNQAPGVVALSGAIRYIDAQGKMGRIARHPPHTPQVLEQLRWGSSLVHGAVMYRREAVLRCGGYRSLFTHSEDYDLWWRLAMHGELENLEDVILLCRVHGTSVTQTHAAMQRHGSLMAQALAMCAARQNGKVLVRENAFPKLEALGLSVEEQNGLKARMLAMNAHLLGDEKEDEEGAVWLEHIKRSPLTNEIRYALGLYHLRCARRYLQRRQPARALRHLVTSVRYSLKPHAWMLKRALTFS